MIKVVVLTTDSSRLYIEEFHRRFQYKFQYNVRNNAIYWDNMMIKLTNDAFARGLRADIAINFDQETTDTLTIKSRINVKKKRKTSYFDLLRAINDDGSFNWSEYLKKEEYIPFEIIF